MEHALEISSRKTFLSLTFLDQLMMTREYFLKNFQKINSKDLSFLNKKNTAFISIPLINLNNIILNNHSFAKFFSMKFLHNLFYKRKLSFIKYSFGMLIEILKGNHIIFQVLINELINKKRINSIQTTMK
jgi:hypothetical protein